MIRQQISIETIVTAIITGCKNLSILDMALELSGDNWSELVAVLNHYSGNTEKLDATRFLIETIPAHYSYAGSKINHYYDYAIRLLAKKDMIPKQQRDSLLTMSPVKFSNILNLTIPDVQIIKADYLISKIDRSYKHWTTCLWASQLTFEQYLEWLLPYKCVELQYFDNWRDSLLARLGTCIKCRIKNNVEYNTVMHVADTIHIETYNSLRRYFLNTYGILPLLNAHLLAHPTFGDTPDYALTVVLALHSVVIPAFMKETSVGLCNKATTRWFVLYSDRGEEYTSEWHLSTTIGKEFFPYDRFPKVLMVSYTMNRRVLKYKKTAKYVYPFDLYEHDVTDHYNLTSDIDIELFDYIRLKDKYVYIGMFPDVSEGSWRALDFGSVSREKDYFQNMGRNMLYIALDYDGVAFTPISNPFILHKDGSVEYIICDNRDYRSVTLKRKYYESFNDVNMRRRLLGGRIQCSNRSDFKDARTLYPIQSTDILDKIQLESVGKYRYWRYDSTYGSIAELGFFDKDGQILSGKPIANIEAGPNTILLAFDNDWLTNFEVAQNPNGNWVGIAFNAPQAVVSVRVIPRSDDSDIHPGQKHELRYLSSRGIWKSLGRKTAVGNKLIYDNVPVKCLLWLKNHTCGTEKRPLFYNDYKMIEWW